MTEEQQVPPTDSQADKYARLLRLADLFDSSGEEMRNRAKLGDAVLADEDVASSEELSPKTYAEAEQDVRAATTGKRGLLARSIELDADALVVRATVLTYRWIDDLQEAAYKTLGSIAGRAIGYLAPEVALGGAIVSAGLIETDALDRDGVAAYLNELALNNPQLLDHVSSGGGGLLDSLQMRSLLTAGVLAGAAGTDAGRAGLRAAGIAPLAGDGASALRDIAGDFTGTPVAAEPDATAEPSDGSITRAPRNVEELMSELAAITRSVSVRQVGENRYIAYLPGPVGTRHGRLRLVGGDHSSYAGRVVAAIERAVGDAGTARVMLVGSAQGGVTAAEVAATLTSTLFAVDQVVTAGAPRSHVHVIPPGTRVLSLEDRADPVALLGSLINVGVANRMTVVFDGGAAAGLSSYVVGGRAADNAADPDLRAELARIHELGYLAG